MGGLKHDPYSYLKSERSAPVRSALRYSPPCGSSRSLAGQLTSDVLPAAAAAAAAVSAATATAARDSLWAGLR